VYENHDFNDVSTDDNHALDDGNAPTMDYPIEEDSHSPPLPQRLVNGVFSILERIGPGEDKKSLPRPVFKRLAILIGGGFVLLVVGLIAGIVLMEGDWVFIVLSLVVSVSFICYGFMLKMRLEKNGVYCANGVCISAIPKMFKRYLCTTFVDVESGKEWTVTLPKKVQFAVGHRYHCYFDTVPQSELSAEMIADMPTNGYLGCEDLGIYGEVPQINSASQD